MTTLEEDIERLIKKQIAAQSKKVDIVEKVFKNMEHEFKKQTPDMRAKRVVEMREIQRATIKIANDLNVPTEYYDFRSMVENESRALDVEYSMHRVLSALCDNGMIAFEGGKYVKTTDRNLCMFANLPKDEDRVCKLISPEELQELILQRIEHHKVGERADVETLAREIYVYSGIMTRNEDIKEELAKLQAKGKILKTAGEYVGMPAATSPASR